MPEIFNIVECFKNMESKISSPRNTLPSNEVLAVLRPELERIGMKVERGKSKGEKIPVPVLFGLNNKVDKFFDADAVSEDGKIVLEVEAGRAVVNYQFLKDIFQASMMHNVEFLVIAVRNNYKGSDDFKTIYTFLELMYITNKLKIPLKRILLIGY